MISSSSISNATISISYTNFARTTLNSTIDNTDTVSDTFTVAGGTGAEFPSSGSFDITLYDSTCDTAESCANVEIMRVTRSTDTFTIVERDLESTAHGSHDWEANDIVELAVTAGHLNNIKTEIDSKLTGTSSLLAVSDSDITSIEDDPATVRTSVRPVVQDLDGVDDDESAGIYIKIDPDSGTTDQQIGIYGEITDEQQDTESAFMKVVHYGAGDAVYIPMFTAAGVAFEAASFVNGSKGIISTIQDEDCANSVLFNALWEQDTVPNYAALYFDQLPANSILIRKTDGANDGYAQFRLMDYDLGKSVFNIFNNGKLFMTSVDASAGDTEVDSPDFVQEGEYWDGGASVGMSYIQRLVVTGAAAAEVRWLLGVSGSEAIKLILNSTGLDLQANTLYGLGAIMCKAGGCNYDGQGGDLVNVTNADFDGTLEGLKKISAHTGTGAVAATECRNNIITNAGASGDIVLSLPAAAAGYEVTVIVSDAHDIDINPDDSDQILVLTDSAGDALSSDATVGSYIHLIAIDATNWIVLDRQGTWTDVN